MYRVQVPDIREDNGRCIGVDIGVNNLAAVASSWGGSPFILNGRPLKSMNQYANREKAHYQSLLGEGRYSSRRIQGLMAKRDRKMKDYLHKASRYLINYCLEHDVTKIVIGQNKNWKQGPGLGKRVNQNFVQVPFARFLGMVTYKAKEHGITVILTEESYTSGTSFLDNEEPTKRYYDKSRRVHRGLFRSNDGTLINADVNAAYQVMKKAVPIQWDRGCVLHPSIVTVA